MDKKIKIILSVATAAVLILLITALGIKANQGKYTPPPFEANAVAGKLDTVGQYYGELELPFDDGNKGIVGLEAVTTVENDEIIVDFSSDSENTVWVSLILTNSNKETVCESGILKPGEYVERLKLSKPVDKNEELSVKILTYQPKTYYSLGSANANLLVK